MDPSRRRHETEMSMSGSQSTFRTAATARALCAGLAVALAAPAASAQQVGGEWIRKHHIYGLRVKGFLGHGVAGPGDLNQDGFADFVVGAPGEDNFRGVVYAYSGKDESPMWSWRDPLFTGVGYSMDGAGDLNGDGRPDVVVGVTTGSNWGTGGTDDVVTFLSDGTVWWVFDPYPAWTLGVDVARAGDVNGDGIGDVVAGDAEAYNATLGIQYGRIFVLSGADASVIHEIWGVHPSGQFGLAVDGGSDVNNDGVPDLLVGAPLAEPGGLTEQGLAVVLSGADGSVIHAFPGPVEGSLGFGLSFSGDLDSDGVDDCLIGAHTANLGGWRTGSLYAYSGRTGSLIYRIDGPIIEDLFGYSVIDIPDVDLDGVDDIAVGVAEDYGDFYGRVQIHSGRTGDWIETIHGTRRNGSFGWFMASMGDMDGDGVSELLVGAEGDNSGGGGTYLGGAAYIHGLDPYLFADARELSVGSSTPLEITFAFPSSEALVPYVLLASSTGTGPTGIGGTLVPLTQDALLSRMLTGWTPPGGTGTTGVLDAEGGGSARIDPVPALAAQIGRTFFLAALSYDSALMTGRLSSAAWPLTIVP